VEQPAPVVPAPEVPPVEPVVPAAPEVPAPAPVTRKLANLAREKALRSALKKPAPPTEAPKPGPRLRFANNADLEQIREITPREIPPARRQIRLSTAPAAAPPPPVIVESANTNEENNLNNLLRELENNTNVNVFNPNNNSNTDVFGENENNNGNNVNSSV
jgi:hypothetical protein